MKSFKVGVLICVLALTACQPSMSKSEAKPDSARNDALPALTKENVAIRPQTTQWLAEANARVLALHDAALAHTTQMARALGDLCAQKTTLKNVQTQWLTTYQSWLAASSIAIGSETLGAQLRHIYFRPARPNLIEEAISNRAHLDSVAADKVGAAAKGLTAIEYVLFTSPNIETHPKRCAYVKWVGDDLLVVAKQLNQDTHKFITQQNEGLRKNDALTGAAALNLWVNSLISRATELAGKDLTKIAVNKPESVLSPYAGKGKALFDAQLQVWLDETFAFANYLDASGQVDLAQSFRVALNKVKQSIKNIPENFAPYAGQTLPQSIAKSISAIQEAQRLLERDIAPAIGVTISANDADGD